MSFVTDIASFSNIRLGFNCYFCSTPSGNHPSKYNLTSWIKHDKKAACLKHLKYYHSVHEASQYLENHRNIGKNSVEDCGSDL